jgi:hypothetical protein
MFDLRSIRATVCLQDCGEPNQSERMVPSLCRQAGVTDITRTLMDDYSALVRPGKAVAAAG